ncbi:ABC transporter permease [Thioalkalivibrio sp. HK1]|uniref:ABC transporter permease n=1 Tax=Thioalkalivibrio sp. HK1 TaxID=1469245 RepID=UPI000470CED9|nr:ABC transporter permease [Thioalkalivibrio sp. HK1]
MRNDRTVGDDLPYTLNREAGNASKSLTEESASPGNDILSSIRRNPLALGGLIVLVMLVLIAVIGQIATTWMPALDPATVRLVDTLRPPLHVVSDLVAAEDRPLFGHYLLGSDHLGRCILARMLQGTPIALLIGFVAVGIAIGIGVLIGGAAGYFGDRRIGPITLDTLLMRFTDIMLCFPTFFLILTVIALVSPSIWNIMIVIGLTSWMGTARLVRGELLTLRERDFVTAAHALGIGKWRILIVHCLPNTLGPVLVTATIAISGAILTESALSFLGFGVQPPFATWGSILADSKNYIFDAPWLFFIPGLAIFAVVLAFNLVGEGLHDAFNPHASGPRGKIK